MTTPGDTGQGSEHSTNPQRGTTLNPTKEFSMQNQLCKILAMVALSTSVTVIAEAQTVTTTINFPFATQGVAVNPITNTIYVVAPNNGTLPTDSLAVIDGKTDTVSQTLSVPLGAQFVTVDYLANRVYVAGCDLTQLPSPCTVTVINGKTNATISTILVTSTPGFGIAGLVANPLTGLVYVANGSDNVINIISSCNESERDAASKFKLAGSISMDGNSPAAIAINILSNKLYVPFGTDETAVVDASTKKIVATSVFGNSTVGAAVNPITGHVFVTDQESTAQSMVGVLNRKGALLASVTVDDSPLGVDVDPITNLAFVASTALDDVAVIDGSNNTLKNTVSSVPASYIAVNFATEKVYVSGRLGVTVMTEK
jgi:DNA-binding beta-propeller fold protein YncE